MGTVSQDFLCKQGSEDLDPLLVQCFLLANQFDSGGTPIQRYGPASKLEPAAMLTKRKSKRQHLCAAFLPLPEHVAIYGLAVLVAVVLQEGARYGAYLLHRSGLLSQLCFKPTCHISRQMC